MICVQAWTGAFTARLFPVLDTMNPVSRPLRLPAAFTDPLWPIHDGFDATGARALATRLGLRTFHDALTAPVPTRRGAFDGAFA